TEVATMLAYTNTTKAIIGNVDADDKRRFVDLVGDSPMSYNDRNAIYINKPGMYSLILRSKMSKAK
ncbi:MAG: Bro-N domain-containing protein, partial [Candidatus Fonsibacter sp.]